mmetsp:Transcript_37114/g.42454  ORF Transcript_37114/g.42454 Transcript_37114/m.42454 type:complete len:1352 (+) Transcript_37114:147-4202(+)
MATLTQVYTNLGIGAIVTTVCYIGFGLAVRFECNKDLTPRAWTRPVQILKNCLSPPYCVNWIHWALSQRYIDLLAGIPGTGTRKKGWSGPTLHTNLDGIVLLRYHTLQFKVSILATILCMVMLLPLYYTAQCDPLRVSRIKCEEHSQNTDFERLTIMNVVADYYTDIVFSNGTTTSQKQSMEASYRNESTINFIDYDLLRTMTWTWTWTLGVTERYLAFAVTITLITIYTCYLLWHEWIECLALRRVYYLESEYYEERLDELDDIRRNSDPEDPFQKVRPPYLPHPEMRETIPNVSLHSVLYKLPSNLDTNFDDTSGKSLLERQLAASVEFFDQCVSNQPGFTSSIAAITILPDAAKVAKVWGKWYACGKKMRRLRYIKSHLETRIKMKREGEVGLHDFVIAAPVNAAKATVKATVEKIEQMKGITSDGIGTVKGITSEGVEQVFGEIEKMKEFAGDEIEKMKKFGKQRMPTQTQPTNVNCSNPSSADSVGDEFFDAITFSNEINVEMKIPDEEMKNAEDSTSSSSIQKHDHEKDSNELKSINNSQIDTVSVDIEAGETIDSGRFSSEYFNACIRESCATVYHDTEHDTEESLSASTSDNLFTSKSSEEEEDDDEEEKDDDEEEEERGQDDMTNITNGESNVLGFKEGTKEHFEYDEFDPETFAKWIGYYEETQLDQLIDTLEIEQLSVYAREMSQSASNPCVYGFGFRSLRLSSIEQLEVMLCDSWLAVREANGILLLARANMFKEEESTRNDSEKKEEDDKDKNIGDETDYDSSRRKSIDKGKAKSVRFSFKKKKNEIIEDDDSPFTLDKSILRSPSGLRKRGRVKSTRAKYDLARKLVDDINAVATTHSGVKDGGYWSNFLSGGKKTTGSKKITVLDYAVVTFTSRQAAICARQCLADNRGTRSWKQIQNIPVTPLADAPPRNIFFCRGCCRPVTLTIPNREKRARKILSWTFYIMFCCLYTVPLSFVSQILNPTLIAARYPNSEFFQDPDNFFFKTLAGISSGLVITLFNSILPQIFKALAFFEGTSSSKVKAEENALRFYWYFILVTSFTGPLLVQMVLSGFQEGSTVGGEFKDILGVVAASLTTTQAPVWLNWILVRTGTTLPVNYLLQFMTFLYGCLHLNWFNRLMRGGGPGSPTPYRIYIDSGIVFMCLISLAPACPIIAPACTLYYTLFIPMLRWLHIFVYRPYYDGGGSKLPVIHEILISSLILGQILLGTLLLLKQSYFCGLYVVFMSVPTYLFSMWTKEKFLRSYEDTGLWQTSKLDGLSNKETLADREKYRRWLVDCHKASYVPICLSGGEDFLTSQPAVVVPIQRDIEEETGNISPRRTLVRQVAQKGAIFRRYIES